MTEKKLEVFYRIKPLLPRSLQIFLRSIRARRILKHLEPPYLHKSYLDSNVHNLSYPDNKQNPVLLTHDVETKEGLDRIEDIRKIEREYGVVSTWNFVLDKYGDVSEYVKKLTDEGCECGAHGLYHDGLLFRDRKTFDERMDKIVEISYHLSIKGFRSPSLHRNREWMEDLPFRWDSSFPAWDPFQPQPGGCEKYLPFRISPVMWEIPVTLFQDFTLFTELKQSTTMIWKTQVDALAKLGLLINIIIHPDYMNQANALLYQGFLKPLLDEHNPWVTIPTDYCDWLESNE